jgi:hypothetical protein
MAQPKGRIEHMRVTWTGDVRMLDLIFAVITAGFFLIAIAYVRVCEKLH